MEATTALDGQGAVVGVAADLLPEPFAGHERAFDAGVGQGPLGLPERPDVRRSIGELEVTMLDEVRLDLLVEDQLLEIPVAVERLAEQRPAGLVAVALDELVGGPFVTGMDDAAVARGRAVAELIGLQQGDPGALSCELAGGAEPRIAATDDHDVGLVRQRPVAVGRHDRHLRSPEGHGLIGIERVVPGGHW